MSQKRKSNDGKDSTVRITLSPADLAARKRSVWNALLLLRLVNTLTLATYFAPDEYYQSLEPAWAMVFGRGSGGAWDGPWVTWEWRHGLRSAAYPMLYAVVYKVTHFICGPLLPVTMETKALIYAPKLVQGFGAAAMDYYTWALAGRIFGENSLEAGAALGLAVFSPWQWFVSTRSMSNCLETTFTIMAMYFWPWESMKTAPSNAGRIRDAQTLKYSVILAAMASMLRPTSLLIWGTLTVALLLHNRQAGLTVLSSAFVWGSFVLLGSTALDVWYYKKLIFPPFNFYVANVRDGLSAFYGENRLDYYFTEGLPMLLTTAMPFAIAGLSQALSGRYLALPADTRGGAIHPVIMRTLGLVALVVPIALSLVPHKEARFIYPVLPVLFIILARPIIAFFHPFPYPSSFPRKAILGLIVVLNVGLATYLGFFHNSGVISAMNYVRSEHERLNPGLVKYGQTTDVNITSIGVMMPCHSVPWRSQLVYHEIQGWALTCEPPINRTEEEKEKYMDEADFFYDDPQLWMKLEFAQQKRAWPDYVVSFEDVRNDVKELVTSNAFEEGWRTFNSLWHDDWRRKGPVVILVKTLSYGGPGRRHDPLPRDAPDADQERIEALLGEGMGIDSEFDELMNKDRAVNAKERMADLKKKKPGVDRSRNK